MKRSIFIDLDHSDQSDIFQVDIFWELLTSTSLFLKWAATFAYRTNYFPINCDPIDHGYGYSLSRSLLLVVRTKVYLRKKPRKAYVLLLERTIMPLKGINANSNLLQVEKFFSQRKNPERMNYFQLQCESTRMLNSAARVKRSERRFCISRRCLAATSSRSLSP